jgi:hypothetical protein
MAKIPQKPKQPLARREPEPAGDAPGYLQKLNDRVTGRGLEEVERQDMTLPRLGLCQSMTPQRTKGDPKFIPGLEEGQYFNSITGENYGEAVKIIPLFFYKTRIRFKGVQLGGGILCQAVDGLHGQGDPGGDCLRCQFADFTENGKPECSKFFNYACILLPEGRLPGLDSLVVVSFKSTSLKVAKDWNALMKLRSVNGKKVDSFSGIYEFSSALQKNNAGQQWSVPVVKNAGWVPEQVFRIAEAMYDSVKSVQEAGRLHFDEEGSGAEAEG